MYKVKDASSDGELVMKSRNVLHGNLYITSFTVLRYSASTDLSVLCLGISIFLTLRINFGTEDVKFVYMQSGPALR